MANKVKPAEDFMSIRDLVQLCLSKWYWFVISLVVTLSVAVLYIKRTPSVYTRTASILIKDDTSGKSVSSNVADLEEFGLFHTNTNVNNEIIALQSPALMQNVVKRLHLDINYTVEGRLHEVVLYGNALPVSVSFPGLGDDAGAGLTVRLLADRRVELSAFSAGGEELTGQAACTAALGDTVATPVGPVVVQPTRYYRGEYSFPIVVTKSSLYGVTRGYAAALTVGLRDEKASVIDLSISDVSTQRGIRVGDSREDVLAAYPEAKSHSDRNPSLNEENCLWIAEDLEADRGLALLLYRDGYTVRHITLTRLL